MFEVSGKAIIKNVQIGTEDSKITIEAKNDGSTIGTVVGWIPADANCIIENVSVWGNRTTQPDWAWGKSVSLRVGGVRGTLSIVNSTVNGAIYGDTNGTLDITCGSETLKMGGTGAFIGSTTAGSNVTLDNCVNNALVGKSSNACKLTGGFIGDVGAAVTIKNCVNNGAIYGADYTGGFVGVDWSSEKIEVINCANYGNVTAKKNTDGCTGGGVIGYIDSASGNVVITDFLNYGDIWTYSGGGVAVGRAETGTNTGLTISVTRLVNFGDVYARWNAGTVVGYTRSAKLIIKNCITDGSLTTSNGTADVFAKYDKDSTGADNNTYPAATVEAENNYYVTAANLDNLGDGSTQKTLSEVLEILNKEENRYSFAPFAFNADKSELVLATPEYVGYQTGAVEGGSYKVRLLATIQNVDLSAENGEYDYLGFEISKDGGATYTKVYTESVYTSVLGKSAEGGVGDEDTAAELGGSYIYGLIIQGVPANQDVTLTIRTFAGYEGDVESYIYGDYYTITLPATVAAGN